VVVLVGVDGAKMEVRGVVVGGEVSIHVESVGRVPKSMCKSKVVSRTAFFKVPYEPGSFVRGNVDVVRAIKREKNGSIDGGV